MSSNRNDKRQRAETLTAIALISMMVALVTLIGYVLIDNDMDSRVALISGSRS